MLKTAVLDDINAIRQIDKSDMLSVIVNSTRHHRQATKLAQRVEIDYDRPRAIIIAGMGGSGIGGELLKDWARNRISIPVEVCREYSLPKYADKDTLVIINSYSGETEESLSVLLDAVKRKCKIACVASGGALLNFAGKLDLPYVQVPSGMPPRAALLYLFMPLLIMLEKIGLIRGLDEESSEAFRVIKKVCAQNSPDKPVNNNFAKTFALQICGTVPVVYGFGIYRSAAQRMKCQFNENSKIPAKWEYFSELNHNEVVGWENPGRLAKDFSAIFIRDENEPDQMHRRIETTKTLLPKSMKSYEILSAGKNSLAKMLSVVCIGDFASVYLAILRRVDPTPVKTITLLKKKLEESGLRKKIVSKLTRIAPADPSSS